MHTATKQRYRVRSHDLPLGKQRAYTLRVKDLEEEQKPREKMVRQGAAVLSPAELLAIIFGTGTRKEEVLSMTSRILHEYGEKSITKQTDPTVVAKELDIPMNKACQLVATVELGRRLYRHPRGRVILRTPQHVYGYLRELGSLKKEQLRGLYVNSRYQLIHDEVITVGSLTSSIVHPREVFRPAIEYAAAAVILCHNHPSGSVKPTQADIETSEQLLHAGKLMGIDLLDHVIIAGQKYKSIFEIEYLSHLLDT